MTIKEINALRKAGQLEDALLAAEEEFSNNANNYTASALFWCLYDRSKIEEDQQEVTALYERMRHLFEEFCPANEYMQTSLMYVESRVDTFGKELKDAVVRAKSGLQTEDILQRAMELFNTGELHKFLLIDLGWLIYFNLKNTPLSQIQRRKQYLFYYLKLDLQRPDLLHSLILSEAVKVEENTPLQFRIRDFMKMWGWENLRDEDWVQLKTDNGHTVSSLVEKFIKVFAKELKTDHVSAPDEFIDLMDKASTHFPNNQYMPLYNAMVLISLGKKDEALKYYQQLIIKSPSKCFLWTQASDLVDDIDTRIGMLCKAISVEQDESFLGECRLKLASALAEKGEFSFAKDEIEKYREFYVSKGWNLKQTFRDVENLISGEAIRQDDSVVFKEYLPLAEEFVYSELPSEIAIKVSDRLMEDKNHQGKKYILWTLRTKDGTIYLKKPNRFGLESRAKNGGIYEVRMHEDKIVWIKPSIINPLQQDWIKKIEGTVKLRVDRNGKTYAILGGAYVGEKLLKKCSDGSCVKIVALKQKDGRWSAISLKTE